MRKATFVLALLFVAAVAMPQLALAGGMPKNVILLIGDGMGTAQVDAASMFKTGATGGLNFESWTNQASCTTYMVDASGNPSTSPTDSAAAGSAIATGQKFMDGEIAYHNGAPVQTVLEVAKARGKMTGVVTSVYLPHATPGAFTAHNPSRDNKAAIWTEMITQTKPNVVMGANRNKYMGHESPAANGYNVVTDRASMQAMNTETQTHVAGLMGGDTSQLPYENGGNFTTTPHLSEMVETTLKVLDNDSDGFFLMVEGGTIDWAAHVGQLANTVQETLEFERCVQKALDWAAVNDPTLADTLILVTADHETGGLNILQNNGQGVYPTVEWTSWIGTEYDHTNRNVGVYAIGANADMISGTMDNTELFDAMVPEPASLALLAGGTVALLRRKRKVA